MQPSHALRVISFVLVCLLFLPDFTPPSYYYAFAGDRCQSWAYYFAVVFVSINAFARTLHDAAPVDGG